MLLVYRSVIWCKRKTEVESMNFPTKWRHLHLRRCTLVPQTHTWTGYTHTRSPKSYTRPCTTAGPTVNQVEWFAQSKTGERLIRCSIMVLSAFKFVFFDSRTVPRALILHRVKSFQTRVENLRFSKVLSSRLWRDALLFCENRRLPIRICRQDNSSTKGQFSSVPTFFWYKKLYILRRLSNNLHM